MKTIIMCKIPFGGYLFVAVLLFFCGSAAGSTLPNSIIRLPENENAILVEKQSQMLYVYSLESNGLNVVFSAPCSTGENPGDKKESGDKKTPEGVYFLIDEYEDRYLTPIYGKKAFPTDYPNFLDQRLGKSGYAIWIHGTDKELKPMDSNGCIALENDSIVLLADYIQLDATPLIIVEKILETDAILQADQEKIILRFVDDWVRSIETGSYHHYLKFYSDEYVPDISWWEKWLTLRKKAKEETILLTLQAVNAGIYTHNSIVVILFDLVLSSDSKKDSGKILLGKRKFFVEDAGQGYKIIGDTYQEKSKAGHPSYLPLIAAAQKLANYIPVQASVMETLEHWLAAWSSNDTDAYAGFYADDFFSDGLGKKAWVARETQLAKRYTYINVTGKAFKIVENNDHCDVYFIQNYESSNFSTQGSKHLKLVRKDGLWKIFQENWKER
jgi:murein L,D-transpeptidase YafK